MSLAELDHLVVTASTLEAGAAHVANCLGIAPHPGGAHPDMGTHNRLLRLDETTYLEVIAIDPQGEDPQDRRWFDLDGDAGTPRLATWVARSRDLAAATAAAGYDAGPIRPMRRGALHWRIAFPRSGELMEGGLLPPLIEWPADMRHPSAALPDDGLSLVRLEAEHPEPDTILAALRPSALDHVLDCREGPAPALRAHIRTPGGIRTLA